MIMVLTSQELETDLLNAEFAMKAAEADLGGNAVRKLGGERHFGVGRDVELAMPGAHHVDPFVERAALRACFEFHRFESSLSLAN